MNLPEVSVDNHGEYVERMRKFNIRDYSIRKGELRTFVSRLLTWWWAPGILLGHDRDWFRTRTCSRGKLEEEFGLVSSFGYPPKASSGSRCHVRGHPMLYASRNAAMAQEEVLSVAPIDTDGLLVTAGIGLKKDFEVSAVVVGELSYVVNSNISQVNIRNGYPLIVSAYKKAKRLNLLFDFCVMVDAFLAEQFR